MPEYEFVPLGPEHRTGVIDILNYYIKETTAAYREEPVPYDHFGDFLEDAGIYPSYAILDSTGTVAGFCMLEPFMPISTFSGTAEITYFIRADCTGAGVGTLALARLEADARRLGIRRLVANLSSENEGSLRFHLSRGFTECGRLEAAGLKFGRPFGVVWMAKEL